MPEGPGDQEHKVCQGRHRGTRGDWADHGGTMGPLETLGEPGGGGGGDQGDTGTMGRHVGPCGQRETG